MLKFAATRSQPTAAAVSARWLEIQARTPLRSARRTATSADGALNRSSIGPGTPPLRVAVAPPEADHRQEERGEEDLRAERDSRHRNDREPFLLQPSEPVRGPALDDDPEEGQAAADDQRGNDDPMLEPE